MKDVDDLKINIAIFGCLVTAGICAIELVRMAAPVEEPVVIERQVEKIIEVEEETVNIELEEETNKLELFTNNDDYYDLEANEYVTEVNLKNTENFQITTDNKTYEELPDDNFELFAAVVASECKDGDIYDALATASSIANRCDSEKWVEYVNSFGMDGENPIDQITFYGQYQGYLSGDYEKYLDGNVSREVMDACEAVWYNGIRNNNYCSFRAAYMKDYSDVQLVEDGNRFDDELENIKVYR